MVTDPYIAFPAAVACGFSNELSMKMLKQAGPSFIDQLNYKKLSEIILS